MVRRIVLLVTVVMVAMTALPAFANHEHFLTTPGTTVQDIASGQTEKCSSAPGGHKFHENVHVGKPGTFAFGQGGQVTVDKSKKATC